KSAPRRRIGRRGALAGGLAASVAVLVGAGVQFVRGQNVRTVRGEVRRFPMADGSEAVMNSQTQLVVRYSEAQRRIDLRAGEAWFDVAKDAGRPFVVATSTATVTAVGTAFSVREIGDSTEVVVSEGTVRIRGEGDSRDMLLSEGGSLRLDKRKPMQRSQLDPGRIRRRLAWRDGLIMLDGETLSEAAAEFNQYGSRPIRVAPEIAERRVVGVFRILDAEGFARANAELLSTRIEVRDHEILLGSMTGS
ncbi:MAG TPA: FecR domain-containing protein, partial [Phenylobacterium sp.]|uniref:FecR family protein n=1 Tax=Phenylobacterium sp. TaxID=1871053 RepID=UPI002F93FB3F